MGRRLAAIMFTDIVGYTALSQEDEAASLRLLREQERLVRGLLEIHSGRLVKSMGDGLLIEFTNSLSAVKCGVDLQRHIRDRNAQEALPELQVRVGIHLGDVQESGADILGDAVNVASRIEPLADPGGVCLSDPVYVQVRNKIPYPLENLGPKTLKGVLEPVNVYRVVLPSGTKEPSPAAPPVPRLAVLPFTNISPDPRDEYFADGMTEELIAVLSQIRGLRVISRTSVSAYKDRPKPIGQVGRELGVSSILEGSVRKAGNRLRITVQLIDVATDDHRWSQSFDRDLDDVFAIQADVARSTAGALRVELLEAERRALLDRPTTDLEAYQAYLKGVDGLRRNLESSSVSEREIEAHFEKAIRLDPEFAAAYSHLANFQLAKLGETRSARETIPSARSLVTRALQLAPESSDAHTARGNLAMQADLDWPLAEGELRRAIELNANNSHAHFWYGFLLLALQRLDEAKAHIRAALDVDPRWLTARLVLSDIVWDSGDFDGAIDQLEALTADFGESSSVWARLAHALFLRGRNEESTRALGRLATIKPLLAENLRADHQAWLGDPGPLREILAAWEQDPKPDPLKHLSVAVEYTLAGEREKAIAFLERDFREGDRVLWFYHMSPGFDPIRAEPRFVDLLRRYNLPTTLRRPLWNLPMSRT